MDTAVAWFKGKTRAGKSLAKKDVKLEHAMLEWHQKTILDQTKTIVALEAELNRLKNAGKSPEKVVNPDPPAHEWTMSLKDEGIPSDPFKVVALHAASFVGRDERGNGTMISHDDFFMVRAKEGEYTEGDKVTAVFGGTKVLKGTVVYSNYSFPGCCLVEVEDDKKPLKPPQHLHYGNRTPEDNYLVVAVDGNTVMVHCGKYWLRPARYALPEKTLGAGVFCLRASVLYSIGIALGPSVHDCRVQHSSMARSSIHYKQRMIAEGKLPGYPTYRP